jgi:adenylate cyclase
VSVPPDQVSAQLERILASPGFVSADRASRFLRFVVERTMAGEGDQLKEYVIGRAVFDRSDDYDPRIDSIVRVEAGRLRSKIDEYYSGPGRTDRVLIQLRRGSYAPAFVSRQSQTPSAQADDAAPAARSRLKRNLGFVAAAFVLLVAVAAWRAGMWAPAASTAHAETIAVLPFANYSEDPAEKLLAARVTDGITAEIARLDTLGVVSHTSALQFADARPRTSLPGIAKALNAQFILEGNVRDEAGRVRIQVRLVNASVDRKFLVKDFAGTASEIPELQRQIAQAASSAIIERKK